MNIELTKPQAELFQSTAKATCATAGFGSGKSQAAMYRMIATMIEYPEADMLYSAPTIPLIRDILWSKLDEFLPGMGLKYSINKSESIVYIHGHGRIFCRSMDNPARLVGFEVVDAFMDELDILQEEKALEVFRKVKARCRQKVYTPRPNGKILRKDKYLKRNQQFVTSTPEGFRGVYKLFKKNPIPDSHLIQMSTYSNPFLPEDYITDLKNSYPPQLIEAYLEGKFVNLVASPVWGAFDTISNSIETEKSNKKQSKSKAKYITNTQGQNHINQLSDIVIPGETLHIGMDFNVGRGCSVIYVKRTLNNKHQSSPYNPDNPTYQKPETVNQMNEHSQGWELMIAVGETYNSFDTPDTIRALNELAPPTTFPKRIIYPDASGTARKSVNATVSDIYLLKKKDFLIKKRLKNPSIKDRVASTNAAFCNGFQQRRLYVDTTTCANFKDALVQQVYDDNGLPKKGKGEFDDIADAGTYPIAYMYPLRHSRMHTEELGGV